MWNNGNGNGNGYGQQGPQGYGGQQPNFGAGPVYDGLTAQTLQNHNRDPFIGDGQHVLAVESIEEFNSQNMGPCVRAIFEVLESKTHPVGSTVSAIWAMLKPAPKPGMTRDQDRFVDFITRLQGAPAGHPIGQDIRVLLKDRPQDQLARGTVIRANGVRKFAKTITEKNKDGFVVVFWDHVEQTPAQIAQMRAKIDARLAASGGAQTGGPAQLGYAQPQGQPQYQGPGPQQPPQGTPQQYGAMVIQNGQAMPPQYGQPQQGAAPQGQPTQPAWGQQPQQPTQGPAQPGPGTQGPPAGNGWNGGNRGW